MVVNELASWLPVVAAAATLIAALMAGTVAITVAMINARAARRQAIENARREFRKAVIQLAIDTSRDLYFAVVRCSAHVREDSSEAIAAFRNDMVGRYYWRIGFPGTGDPLFNRVMAVYESMPVDVLPTITEAPPDRMLRNIKPLTEISFEVNELIQAADVTGFFGPLITGE